MNVSLDRSCIPKRSSGQSNFRFACVATGGVPIPLQGDWYGERSWHLPVAIVRGERQSVARGSLSADTESPCLSPRPDLAVDQLVSRPPEPVSLPSS
jgi:hypothetical protein